MRPNILTAAIVVLMPAASSAAPASPATSAAAPETVPVAPMHVLDPLEEARDCPDTPMSLARKAAERPTLRHLNDLPPAEAFAAVDRRVDHCPAPMYLREARGR